MENLTIDAIRQNFWLSMIFATVLTSLFWYVLNTFPFFEKIKNTYIVLVLTGLSTFFLTDFQNTSQFVDWQNIGFKAVFTFAVALTVAENSGIMIVKRLIKFVTSIIMSFFNRIKNTFVANENKQQSNNQ